MAEGQPTGSALATGTTNGDTISASPTFENREVTLGAGVELTSGTKYAIEVSAASGDKDNDQLLWVATTGSAYANGSQWESDDSGSSWAEFATRDNWFQTKAEAVVKDSYTPASDAVQTGFAGVEWSAQTFTPSSTYTITSVVLRMARWAAFAAPGTITVNIKATESAAPTKATNPTPADTATSVTNNQATITWDDGGGADTFDVYYGTESGSLSLVSSAQAGTSFTVTGITDGSPYNHLSTRYWRIDSTSTGGTTTGDEWSFTTLRLDPPGPTRFYVTTGQYYQLLVQSDGSLGDPPGVGVENTDFVYLAAGYEANFISTTRKLVAIAENRFWYEDL